MYIVYMVYSEIYNMGGILKLNGILKKQNKTAFFLGLIFFPTKPILFDFF